MLSGCAVWVWCYVLCDRQNRTFTDAYTGVPFDLSRVMFIATANTATPISPPLLDRMEVRHRMFTQTLGSIPEWRCVLMDPTNTAGFLCWPLSRAFTPPLPPPQMIALEGYTLEEKLQIARVHLLPKQIRRHGLLPGSVIVGDDVMQVTDKTARSARWPGAMSRCLHGSRTDLVPVPVPAELTVSMCPHVQLLCAGGFACYCPHCGPLTVWLPGWS